MPVVYYTFLAGAASLAALPFVTSGFFSKDQILWYAWTAENGNGFFWLAGLAGALITAFYTARLLLIVFWGEERTHVSSLPGKLMTTPLVILAVLSISAGFIEWPHNLLHATLFSDFTSRTLPATLVRNTGINEGIFQAIAIAVTLLGVYIGYQLYYKYRDKTEQAMALSSQQQFSARNFFYNGWEFDALYNSVFVKPFLFITQVNRADLFDQISKGVSGGFNRLNDWFSVSQNGSLRWYGAGVLFGIIFILTLEILL
jgi:NADH-quinone oxidoreductase subunit L